MRHDYLTLRSLESTTRHLKPFGLHEKKRNRQNKESKHLYLLSSCKPKDRRGLRPVKGAGEGTAQPKKQKMIKA